MTVVFWSHVRRSYYKQRQNYVKYHYA